MKFLRLLALTLTFSSFSFAANKDLIALQRDLEAKMDAMQQTLSSKIDVMTGTLQAIQNDSRRTADQIATLQESLSSALSRSLAPVNNLNSRVEAMGEDTRALRDALADLSARLERMDAKITDLKNQMQIMQNPPPAPGSAGPTTTPGAPGQSGTAAAPPTGMSADKTYTDARRDQQTGNVDLAYGEYQQYLTYFSNTELAANAQYYMGEIDYNRGNYKGAVQSFDAVLERYPNNPKTADARYMKGMALAKDGQRTRAIQELRSLVQSNPNSEQARKATQALRDARLFPSNAPSRRTTR
ncbi:MAG: tetratricopeptide repeat protein [Acidobacteriaceae bacterium]|nr:tetratricopeptide repeat protein [Acidobacteriaceae bacterium]MBV9938662.1 tetratricopeptide repeat protein [Acidobacteriaceae bacterium]